VVFDGNGDVIKELEYNSFGVLVHDSASWFGLPIGFAGGIVDPITGLVRFGFRDYDPETGRWTAKDPILFAGGQMNLYAYVLNNPVSYADPAGLDWSEYVLSRWFQDLIDATLDVLTDESTREAELEASRIEEELAKYREPESPQELDDGGNGACSVSPSETMTNPNDIQSLDDAEARLLGTK
jgi:RHS repeat-associated protein